MQSDLASLHSLCLLVADCPHSTPVWTDSGHFVVRNQNIKSGRLDLSSPSFTDREHFEHRTRRAKPRADDIIITREAPMGEVCIVPDGLECCLGQRQVLLRPNPAVVDARFLLYALQSPSVQHQIGWSEGTGSTVSNLRIPHLEALKIPSPPKDVQTSVASILGALDDRVKLVQETNSTLESIAHAIFKSWFIDFDPVRTKAEGREPEGMDAATAALFPSEFEESELGSIPKGWTVGTVEDLVVLQRGFDLPSGARTPGPFPIMAASGPSGTHNESMARAPGVTTGRSGVLGQVYYVQKDFWPLNTSLWVKEFRGAKPTYAFQLLRTLDLAHLNAGSAVPTLNRNHVHIKKVIVPTMAVVKAYEDVASTLLMRVESSEEHAKVLSSLRDELLPRLISGKLRIPEAEEQMQEAIA